MTVLQIILISVYGLFDLIGIIALGIAYPYLNNLKYVILVVLLLWVAAFKLNLWAGADRFSDEPLSKESCRKLIMVIAVLLAAIDILLPT